MINKNEFRDYLHRSDKQLFNIGDEVFTNINGCLGGRILDVHEKTFYLVKHKFKERIPYSSGTKIVEQTSWFAEWQLSLKGVEETSFVKKIDWKDKIISINNKKTIIAWFNMVIEKGGLEGYPTLNLSPSYQRDLVWTIEDKCSLLDSIFNRRHTGNLIVIEKDYNYEVLDGKQRLSTVCEFILNKFKYKGKYFHDLSLRDKNAIKSHYFHYTQVSGDLTEKQKVSLFIDFNTTGTQVDTKFIKSLKNKYFKGEE